jgi:wyosine [tRNA(Phe)-imidazoG37] synthetase (radical SAM superfamily)
MQQNNPPDTIFLTGSGEPALYSKFGELARKVKEKYPSITTTAYSNASLLTDSEVRNDFYECDIMQFNLNAVTAEEFSRINQHHGKVKLDDVIEGLKKFKVESNKPIWIHSIFGDNFNISEENIIGLRNFVSELNPDKYIIRKFEIENKVKPLREETINFIKNQMGSLSCKCHYMGFD